MTTQTEIDLDGRKGQTRRLDERCGGRDVPCDTCGGTIKKKDTMVVRIWRGIVYKMCETCGDKFKKEE